MTLYLTSNVHSLM